MSLVVIASCHLRSEELGLNSDESYGPLRRSSKCFSDLLLDRSEILMLSSSLNSATINTRVWPHGNEYHLKMHISNLNRLSLALPTFVY